MAELFTFFEPEAAQRSPLLISIPHAGTHIPPDVAARMTDEGTSVPDTDWHVDRLYDFTRTAGVSVIAATHSRYVVDLNRPPDGKPLYPGASNTELCPTSSFGDKPLYVPGNEPDAGEVDARREVYWRPYHDRIEKTLNQLKAQHGFALLYDAHSICSEVPRFFDGRLPDLNLGTVEGRSCAPSLRDALSQVAQNAAPTYTMADDGRFKGGYITRRYGNPNQAIHAFQLELSWRTYMDETPPFGFCEDLASGIRPVLKALVETMRDWRPI